jgi:hypothetical protein
LDTSGIGALKRQRYVTPPRQESDAIGESSATQLSSRQVARGAARAFVYVLPLQVDEILKLGFSRDPLGRMQTLHPRYFDFFDLDRVCLIETDRVREARQIESALKRRLRDHRAPMPIEVRHVAGGHTEWFRGAYATLRQIAEELSNQGYNVHLAARPWLRQQVLERSPVLFEWSSQLLSEMRLASDACETSIRDSLAVALRDALDALRALDIDVAGVVPAEVCDWFATYSRRAAPF